jgi:threonine/homoserine/homoserine lactone efflux protein
MSEYLSRFNLDDPKFNYMIVAAMILIWLAILVCALSSINSQSWTRRQRIFWISIVTGLPFLGILAYLPFSIRMENYPHLKLLKKELR